MSDKKIVPPLGLTRTRIRTQMHRQTHMRTHIDGKTDALALAHVHAHWRQRHTHMYTRARTHTHTHTDGRDRRTCTHTRAHTHTHTDGRQTHMHTHAHTHTPTMTAETYAHVHTRAHAVVSLHFRLRGVSYLWKISNLWLNLKLKMVYSATGVSKVERVWFESIYSHGDCQKSVSLQSQVEAEARDNLLLPPVYLLFRLRNICFERADQVQHLNQFLVRA